MVEMTLDGKIEDALELASNGASLRGVVDALALFNQYGWPPRSRRDEAMSCYYRDLRANQSFSNDLERQLRFAVRTLDELGAEFDAEATPREKTEAVLRYAASVLD